MITKAKAKNIRISPRKARLVIDEVRGKDVVSSLAALKVINRRASQPVEKLIKSAVSNAKQKGVGEHQLYISKITADPGPTWKRFRAAPFGRAVRILKRTTHISLELDLLK